MSYTRGKSGNPNIRIFLIFFGVMTITLFFVWTRLQNIRIRREISRLSAVETKINFENGQLKLRLAQITSPRRLEDIGVKKYGLKRPSPKQVILLKEQ